MISIEQNVFKQAKFDFNKLEKFGFEKSNDVWQYVTTFMSGDFKALVTIDDNGNIQGQVFEVATDDIFLPLRIEGMDGFAAKVREEYIKILGNIKEKCCETACFMYQQANRLTQRIYEKYGDSPSFPWEKFDNYGVFKNPTNNKWYALIMSIDFSKLDKKECGEIEVVNIKINKEKIPDLIEQNGFYPAYHMNKKNWITITLNDSVADGVLFELLDESHTFTLRSSNKKKD